MHRAHDKIKAAIRSLNIMSKFPVAIILSVFLQSVCALPDPVNFSRSDNPSVTLDSAKITGVSVDSGAVDQYLNIPYALPP